MEIEVLDSIDIKDKKVTIEAEEIEKIINEMQSLNILLINIRGVKTNLDKLLVFMQSYNLQKCEIIVLTECHNLNSTSTVNIPNYKVYYDNANFNTYDGLLIYTKDSLISTSISTQTLRTSKISITNLLVNYNNKKISLNVCYRSPNSNSKDFIEDLDSYMNSKRSNDVEIFMGDINLNILNNSEHLINEYLSVMATHGYVSLYQDVTRPESKSCLDHVFLNKKINDHLDVRPAIVNYDITDHLPILINFFSNDKKTTTSIKKSSTYTKINFEKLNNQAREKNWKGILDIPDPELATEKLITTINHTVKESQELVNYNKFNKIKPWITNGIITSIKKKR